LSWILDIVSVTSGSLNTDVAFVRIDLLSFTIRIWTNDLTAINSFWKDMNFLFLSFCPFSDIVFHRVHKKLEVVFLNYGPWLTILWTFNKEFTKKFWILNAIDTFVWPKGKQLLQKRGKGV
jgi:hypothetical protein